MAMRVVGIVPARYGSTRLPAKALAMLQGVPMVVHVYEQAKQAKGLDEVLVATDDERIMAAVIRAGGKAVMTSAAHRSGTERIAEVARQLEAQVILNIQGDEPLIHPEPIQQIAEFLLAHPAVPMATVKTPMTRAEDARNPNVVKIVTDADGYALYFSRSAIPYVWTTGKETEDLTSRLSWKHLGLYGYQRAFLLQFPTLPTTALEQGERLEQLRALYHGYKIKVLETGYDSIGVDTLEDLTRVEQLMRGRATAQPG